MKVRVLTVVTWSCLLGAVVVAMAMRAYIGRVDSDVTIAHGMFAGSWLLAMVSAASGRVAHGWHLELVGLLIGAVAVGLVSASLLASQDQDLLDWNLSLTLAASTGLALLGAALVVTSEPTPDRPFWLLMVSLVWVAGAVASLGYGLERVPREFMVGDDAVETRLVLDSRPWLIAWFVALALMTWVAPARVWLRSAGRSDLVGRMRRLHANER